MKRMILAISMALIALGIGIYETVYISRVADRTIEYVEEAVKYSKENNGAMTPKTLETLKSARKYWHNSGRIMKIFLSHEKEREISENLIEIQERIGMEEIEEFYSLCEKTKGQLASIKENELPLIENIL